MNLLVYLETQRRKQNWFPNVLYAFMFSVSAYLAGFRKLDARTDFLAERATFGQNADYDFIIVGGGTAGGLLANRLSAKYSVLLLEAGGDPHPLHSFPVFALFLLNYPEIDWCHRSTPQKNSSLAQNHRESLLSQGKALGGTSNLNFMIHSRGHPRDFDEWAKILDDPDWSYDKLLPYFKKHENYIDNPFIRTGNASDELHGHDGELDIQVPDFTGMAEIYLKAVEEAGYERVDLNGRYKQGFDFSHCPMKFGRRQSSFSAFLEPIRDSRPNLTIHKFAHVTKILFGTENEAYGVKYEHHHITRYAYARREIILSAGAINTPKLLMLSGIGPKDHLEEIGIPVLQDLPVGQRLMDHASTFLGPFFLNDSISFLADRDLRAPALPSFLRRGRGPMTSTSASAFGFISSQFAKSSGKEDWPDVQIIFSGASICQECDAFLAHGFNVKEEVLKQYYWNAKGRDSFIQIVSNARPKARGEVRLRSSDPFVPALIDPKYLDNEQDLQVMIEGVKEAVRIAENTTALQKYGTYFTDEAFPGCHGIEFRSDEYWKCYIRHFTISLHHLTGTCAMARSGVDGVVDSKLRVFGTKRLRVVDASVMPQISIGNTNAPTMMIAEKGAALIQELWEKGSKSKSKV